MREPTGTILTGLLFGFVLSNVGFSSWDETHRMFTLDDQRMLLAFAFAALLLSLAWVPIRKWQHPSWPHRGVHPGIVPGSIAFGAGWALCGACPSIALVQVGEGQLGGMLTLLGMLLGNYAYSVLHERYFRWPASSCMDD